MAAHDPLQPVTAQMTKRRVRRYTGHSPGDFARFRPQYPLQDIEQSTPSSRTLSHGFLSGLEKEHQAGTDVIADFPALASFLYQPHLVTGNVCIRGLQIS